MKPTPDYIAGFVDGEGCFALKFRRDFKDKRKKQKEYFYWTAEFAIVLRSDDSDILRYIKETLRCGNINFAKNRNQVRYSVQDIEKLKNIIIPFFKTNRLFGKKQYDFDLWSEAVEILYKTKRGNTINSKTGTRGFLYTNWNLKDLEKLKDIHQKMKPIKSRVKEWKWLR